MSMMARALLLALLLASSADLAAADAWMRYEDGSRSLLNYETLGGYRLFFHPAERDPLRRSLVLSVPKVARLKQAWLLIRPLTPRTRRPDAWLRVEGYREFDHVRFDWDGTYRKGEFPDGFYEVDVRVTLEGAPERRWTVVILKSLDHPRFARINGADLGLRRCALAESGAFDPTQEEAAFSRALGKVEILGRLWLPELEGDFSLGGALLMARPVQGPDKRGRYKLGAWECMARQALPPESPARRQPKKVRFQWEVAGLKPGLYDLKLALFHPLVVNASVDPCNLPVLDYDVLRVRVTE
jgi:hypothetical protein